MAAESLTISDQIWKLKTKGLVLNDLAFARDILERKNYYNVINAFKDLFIDSTASSETFISGTTFEELFAVYEFDLILRELFLKYILIIENELKTHVAYEFSLSSNSGGYFCKSNYSLEERKIKPFFESIIGIIMRNNSNPMVSHFIERGDMIPIWALINCFQFGELRNFYNSLSNTIKNKVSRYYNISSSELYSMLSAINMFRNVCAHSNRLYNYKIVDNDKQISNMNVHSNMNIEMNSLIQPQYIRGKKDLFALVICFKYLLTNEDFLSFINSLEDNINNCATKITTISMDAIIDKMGFPLASSASGQLDWKDIRTISK